MLCFNRDADILLVKEMALKYLKECKDSTEEERVVKIIQDANGQLSPFVHLHIVENIRLAEFKRCELLKKLEQQNSRTVTLSLKASKTIIHRPNFKYQGIVHENDWQTIEEKFVSIDQVLDGLVADKVTIELDTFNGTSPNSIERLQRALELKAQLDARIDREKCDNVEPKTVKAADLKMTVNVDSETLIKQMLKINEVWGKNLQQQLEDIQEARYRGAGK
ncbi:hypothetical protein [Enterococcus phage vB_EfaS_140]|uniref:Uncharacterized protein n=1 Tax=Enterococcus phage vB_EfaS_140 TaxID=2730536 RepID=A0ACA9ASK2_9CAUD|nr:hypothetical protein [Enterococcus phage vB_EfaS_140]